MKSAARVLLVEDNEDDVLLIQEVAAGSGLAIELRVAGTVEEARALLASLGGGDAFDLVLLDLNLPGQDGFALLEAGDGLRGGGPSPVVMLTTSKRPRDQVRARSLGVDAFVSKPIGLGEFRQVVGEVFREFLRREERR